MDETIIRAVEWLKGLSRQGSRLQLDSRQIRPGDIFVGVPGAKVDGRNFIRVAAARGAAGALVEAQNGPEHFPIPVLGVEDLRRRLGEIADLFYGSPSAEMTGIAATGTNGKTTVTHWIAQLFTILGRPTAVMGTVGCFFNGAKVEIPSLTTPDSASLHGALRTIRDVGAECFAFEASSIGLEQGRVNGVKISTAVYTNLTRDHLDYHGTMEDYAAAKELLFSRPGLRNAVVNADDAHARRMIDAALAGGARVWLVSIKDDFEPPAGCEFVRASRVRAAEAGMKFTLEACGRSMELEVPVLGEFNVSNLLSAAAAALAEGFGFDEVAGALVKLKAPAGRMQIESRPGMPLAVIDYSHTPDALQKALEALRPAAQARGGRLAVVFGCGGDRDAGKRPMMGGIAERLADKVVITTDNPRTEDPDAIIADIAAGAPSALIEPDRAAAVCRAVVEAQACDVVLVAGKGHEEYQDVCGVKHHFSDREAVHEAFNERFVRERRAGDHAVD